MSRLRTLLRHAEYRLLIGIEGNRAAMGLEIRLQRLEITERALGFDEAQLHQRSGRIVDEDEQGVGRAAILEPVMMIRVVDLGQLAKTSPEQTWLVEGTALLARQPDTVVLHPFEQPLW